MNRIVKLSLIALCMGIAFPAAVSARDRVIIIEMGGNVSPAAACRARCMRQSDHCNAMKGGVQAVNGCGINRTMCITQC